MTGIVRTTCPYCGVGCGVLATPDGKGGAAVEGDPNHPANYGRLCVKGSALGETLSMEGRLLHPEIGGRQASWSLALDSVAESIRTAITEHGPNSVAFYLSGQLLTEDYYVPNKLMKGFIGSNNLDTNSRLCMASSVVGHRRGFGSDTVPGCYEDIELADLVILTGSNLAWCHPVLHQRLEAARAERDIKVVVIDPRRTASCVGTDLHLALTPGSDVTLFNGLLADLDKRGLIDRAAASSYADGLAETIDAATRDAPDAQTTARLCGLAASDVAQFFDLVARHEKVVTLYSQGINQSTSGSDKVNAILNMHLATGRIGRPGMGPFSLTGQPNAMGGREVGALANQLAAHMDYGDAGALDRVRRFWKAPSLATGAGPKAVQLFERVARGEIRVLWIMATNPAVSLPRSDAIRQALEACPLVIVSDAMRWSDTVEHAYIRLPALAWGEKDGTVTNSERRISRQRAFLPAPGEARPDWWIVSEVARRLGFGDEFAYDGPAAIFREHAALSGFENDGSRDFDLSALATMDDQDYAGMKPVQWPVTVAAPEGTKRLFGDRHFFTPDHRAKLVPLAVRKVAHPADRDYPITLLTGRERDHWHTLNRTGKSARLTLRAPEPVVAVNPADAQRLRLEEGGLVKLQSRWGGMIARLRITEDQNPGTAFAPMHWNDHFSAYARVNALAHPAVDPLSGQPEFKSIPVRLVPIKRDWEAAVLLRSRPIGVDAPYWAIASGVQHWRVFAAGDGTPEQALDRLAALLPAGKAVTFRDPVGKRFRVAVITEGELGGWLDIRPPTLTLDTDWVGALFAKDRLAPEERRALLVGRAGAATVHDGPIVCACHHVGRNKICRAIAEQGLGDVRAIGIALGAGTGCGSCVPELRALLAEATKVGVAA
jgi:assimilatory nitrate reductase catalytic subunit